VNVALREGAIDEDGQAVDLLVEGDGGDVRPHVHEADVIHVEVDEALKVESKRFLHATPDSNHTSSPSGCKKTRTLSGGVAALHTPATGEQAFGLLSV